MFFYSKGFFQFQPIYFGFGGDTAKGAKERAESLQAWLKGKKGYYGGIAVQDGSNGWKINTDTKYEYTTALKEWKDLEDFLE